MKKYKQIKSGYTSVYLGTDILNQLKVLLPKQIDYYNNCFVLVDDNTGKYCLPLLKEKLPQLNNAGIITIKSGENFKNFKSYKRIIDELIKTKADRSSILINLGGGVISDMGGFAASTFKRGISFINVPTTLVGQVDASIGGKTGINIKNIKNQIGSFAHPLFILIDTIFLKTLPYEELLSGYAELLKYGLIYDNKLWTRLLEKNLREKDVEWEKLIEKPVKIKLRIIDRDLHEMNKRKLLNFGHTTGHAIESLFLNKKNETITHGEAIASGMICESYISFIKGLLSEDELIEIYNGIGKFFSKIKLMNDDIDSILYYMKHDKKKSGDSYNFTLLKSIGKAIIDQDVTEAQITDSIKAYHNI